MCWGDYSKCLRTTDGAVYAVALIDWPTILIKFSIFNGNWAMYLLDLRLHRIEKLLNLAELKL